ncbi:hypothetical protein D0T85_07765 [Bacteroides sp. 519]|nr:hypothetical protein [Bacteroides sp. 519]
MKTNILFNYIISLCLFCCSCTSGKISNTILLQADSLIECCSDSVLLLLQSIEQPQSMSKAEQALYALLKTQADDKNYVTHTCDSLIQVAVDYYKDRNDYDKKIRAYFYLGSVYRDMGMRTEAIKVFLKVKRDIQKNNLNSRLLYLTHINLTSLYENQDFYPDAMNESREAYYNCIIRNDSLDLVYPMMDIGRLFLYSDNIDSSLLYQKQALTIIENSNDQTLYPVILRNIAHAHDLNHESEQANYYITKALNASTIKADSLSFLYIKGKILRNLNNEDSARVCFNYSKNSEDIYTQASSYLALYELEKKVGNWEKSLESMDIYYALQDSLYNIKRHAEVASLMTKHEIEIGLQNLKNKQKNERLLMIAVFLMLIFACFFVFMWLYNQKKKQLIEQQESIIQIQTKALYAEIDHSPIMIDDEIIEIDDIKEESFIRIKEQLTVQANLFKEEQVYKNILLLVTNASEENCRIPDSNRKEVLKTVRSFFCMVINELMEAYPITKTDAEFCVFCFLGFSYKEIVLFFAFSSTDVCKTRKNRIKSKLKSEEMFSFLFYSKRQ